MKSVYSFADMVARISLIYASNKKNIKISKRDFFDNLCRSHFANWKEKFGYTSYSAFKRDVSNSLKKHKGDSYAKAMNEKKSRKKDERSTQLLIKFK